jgi:hypothetical protein
MHMTRIHLAIVAAAALLFVTALSAQQAPAAGAKPAAPKAAAAAPAGPQYKAIGTVKEIMVGIMAPASNSLFGAAAELPTKDEDWLTVEHNTLLVAEMPNLLMLPGRSNPDPRWRMWVQRLRTNSEAALKAVKAKNGDMISAAGDKVYETCEGCHMIFLPENQQKK